MTRMVELAPLKLKRHLYQKKSGNLSARLIALLPRRSAAISCSTTQAAERLSRLSCFPVRFSGSLKRLAGAFRPEAIRDGEGQCPVRQGGLPKQTWNDRARSNVARLQSRD